MLGKDDHSNSLDRRIFLGASTATLLGLPGVSLAQQQGPSGSGKVSDPAGRAPSQALADFVTGFDLKSEKVVHLCHQSDGKFRGSSKA
jgi:hypothetical protein